MAIYPRKIDVQCTSPKHAGEPAFRSAIGRGAAFECGTTIEIRLRVDGESKLIESISYKTNGCGFMLATAELLAANFQRTKLTDLHGTDEIQASIIKEFSDLPFNRGHCVSVVIEAFRHALSDHRSRYVEEFRGEKALICTCFGIDEERIVSVIADRNITDVDEVVDACNAGRGCGSCRYLIQELIDSAQHKL